MRLFLCISVATPQHLVFALKRKGHIKLALRHGVAVVPCYCFGETDLYVQSRFAFSLRRRDR